jgi:hypothetical protein
MSFEEHTSKFFESSYDGKYLLFQCSIIFAMALSVAREVGNRPSFLDDTHAKLEVRALVCMLNHLLWSGQAQP